MVTLIIPATINYACALTHAAKVTKDASAKHADAAANTITERGDVVNPTDYADLITGVVVLIALAVQVYIAKYYIDRAYGKGENNDKENA